MTIRRTVIVTGSNGMLGKDVVDALSQEEGTTIFGLNRTVQKDLSDYVKQVALDLTDIDVLKKTIKDISPETIIHCAANVDLNACEKNEKYAHALHVEATDVLVSYRPDKVKFIYISTDSVFDGEKGDYKETDQPNPVNCYARTKLDGEIVTLKRNPNAIILRSTIYGFNSSKKGSLVEWAIENLKKGNTINGFTDVFFNPVYTKQLAMIIARLLKDNSYSGILNVGCDDYVSKYSFIMRLAEIFGFSEISINKSSMTDAALETLRPRNTTLNINALRNIFQEVPSLEKGLKELKDDYDEKN